MNAKIKKKNRDKINQLSAKAGIQVPQSKDENDLLARQAHIKVS